MTFNGLNRKQQVALVALVEAMTMSDGFVSEGEEKEISKLAGEMGDDLYRDLMNQVDENYPTLDSLKDYLQTVEDGEVQELIYGIVIEELMAAPSAKGTGTEIRDWLSRTWSITDTAADTPSATV